MKKIPLTQNKFAVVDDDDFDWLNQWKWCAVKGRHTYYAYRCVKRRRKSKSKFALMHRIILNVPDGKFTDHINRNGLDNRRCNLRICTASENRQNCIGHKKDAPYKGITKRKDTGKWQAQAGCNGKHYCFGSYKTAIEAAKAYDEGAKKLFGEFARLNFSQ